MIAEKRREVEVFSLSFMDVICCGFGAVLLIFILTTGRQSTVSATEISDLRALVSRLEREIDVEKIEMDRAAQASVTEQKLQRIRQQNTDEQRKIGAREHELQLLLQQIQSFNQEVASLTEAKNAAPDEKAETVPVPNLGRQHYLTGFKLEGEFILMLVEASGGMLDESIDSAVARLEDPDYKKREAPKWQRVVKSVEWMIATLNPDAHFQVFLFNEDTVALLPNRADEWFSPRDRDTVPEVLTKLHTVVPQGPANLERAFATVRYMGRLPDSIVLFTDGLPTTSDSIPGQSDVDDRLRIRFFQTAQRSLPPRVPINIILFPMNGDPAAPALYWNLAIATRGAFVSPARDWPDI